MIAAFSAGRPKASKPLGKKTFRPCIRLNLAKISGFTLIIGLGGIISGGIALILILLMAKNAKAKGDRKPEYSIPYNKWVMWIIVLFIILGAIAEIINLLR